MLKKVLLFFWGTLTLSSQIPSTYINQLHKPFNQIGKDYLNPTLGFIFATHLAPQMRFYGSYKFGFKENNERLFAKDEGQDGIFKLIRLLFPSDGGNLSTESTSLNNFGNVLKHGSIEERINLIGEILLDIDLIRQGAKKSCLGTNSPKGLIHWYPKPKPDNGNRSACFKKLQQAILTALQAEKLEVYPKYFVEQIILGFFWQHFNSAQDLEMLVNLLLQSDLEKHKPTIPKWTADPFTIEQLSDLQAKAAANPASLNLEECLQLNYFPNFFAKITPYAPGECLISNGLINFVSRDEQGRSQLQSEGGQFADCTETTLRQLVIVNMYNPTIGNFNHEAIRLCQNRDLDRFFGLNLSSEDKTVTTIQTIENANNGATAIRNAWNCVVADLNHPNFHQIDDAENPLAPAKYNLKSTPLTTNGPNNEIIPGLINIANVLGRILNKPSITIKLQNQLLKNPTDKAQLLTKIYKQLLNNDNVTIKIRHSNDQDFYGTLCFDINANNKQQKFCLQIDPDHAQLNNLTPNSNDPTKITLPSIELHNSNLSFMLLIPEWNPNINHIRPTSMLYYLYNQPMQDDFDKINFLKRMLNCPHNRLIEQINLSACMLLLQEIAWQNTTVAHQGWPVLIELIKQKWPNVRLDIKKYLANSMHQYALQQYLNTNNLSLREVFQNINIDTAEKLQSLNRLNLDKGRLMLKNLEIETLPNLIPSLKELEIDSCKKLLSLDSLINISQLQKLTLNNCYELTQLPSLPDNLEELTISNCSELTPPIDLDKHEGLKKLKLDLDYEITEFVNQLPNNLKELELKNCSVMQPPLQKLSEHQQLQKLSIVNFDSLNQLPSLPQSLRKLRIVQYPDLEALNSLSGHEQITKLTLESLNTLRELPKLPQNLVKVKIVNCPDLKALDSLSGHEQIKEISLQSLNVLRKLPKLPRNLVKLKIINCPNLKALNGLSEHERITKLTLEGLNSLHNLPRLPPNLIDLKIVNCPNLKALDSLSEHANITKLTLKHLSDLDQSTKLPPNITKLKIVNCPSLEFLIDLTQYENLKKISGVYAPSDAHERWHDISLPKNLEKLSLRSTNKLASVMHIAQMHKLKTISFMLETESLLELLSLPLDKYSFALTKISCESPTRLTWKVKFVAKEDF